MRKINISERRWLILPIETKARELLGKLLLACYAAERGWGVIIGSKGATNGNQNLLPRGTFVEKSLAGIAAIISVGHRASAWHEEGLVYVNTADYSRRLIAQSFDAIDYFFAWGNKEAEDALAVMKRGKEKIIISGNPRFDLLRPEFRHVFYPSAQRIRERYGKIILVNTKFVTFNSANPKARRNPVAYLKAIGRIKNEEQEKIFHRIIQLQKKVFPCFLEMFPVLSRRFKEHTIVIRPHPSESEAPWIEAAKRLSNVKVVYEGNVNEWILASDVVVHSNCTTGVEAFLLGKPAISYRPFKDEGAEFKLPNEASFQAENENELMEMINYFISDNANSKNYDQKRLEQLNFVKQYIANIDGKPACETIMDTLDKLELPLSEGHFPVMRGGIVKYYLRKIKKRLSHTRRKFPGINLSEMDQALSELKKVSGRFSDIKIAQVDIDGFCVYKP